MVYNALIESRFSETVKEAREKIRQDGYDGASDSIKCAKHLVLNLPPPQNLPEKLQYLDLKVKMYETLLEVCDELYYAIPQAEEGITDEDRKIVEQKILDKLEEPASRLANSLGYGPYFESIQELESLLDNCATEIEEIDKTI